MVGKCMLAASSALLAVSALFSAGQPAEKAGIVLKDMAGLPRNLEDARGRIVVMNFWATWCAPCLQEVPLLNKIHSHYGARGVMVIGASADDERTSPKLAGFIRRAKINYPVWVGATTLDMEALGLGGALPATAILDRDGEIVERINGVLDALELEARIVWLLGDRSGPASNGPLARAKESIHAGHQHAMEHGGKGHSHEHTAMDGLALVPS